MNDIACAIEIQVLQDLAGAGTYTTHDGSIVTQINSIASNPLSIAATGTTAKTIVLTVDTIDLNLDSDGANLAPVINFKIVIAAPNVSLAPGDATNPIELVLTLTVKHPCRNSVLTNQVIPDITSNVNFGPDSYYVTPFVHSLFGSAYDCGLQQFSIFEDSVWPYLYSAFTSVSALIDTSVYHVITVNSVLLTHVKVHNPYAVVTLIDWPEVTINTA